MSQFKVFLESLLVMFVHNSILSTICVHISYNIISYNVISIYWLKVNYLFYATQLTNNWGLKEPSAYIAKLFEQISLAQSPR